ncbi:MAG TPA: hypoxanthine phosphoribosyltransferase [Vicinamibacteria bacterium]|nr:hypoxanthine phosphoribosyltransferase [Vicinamibacteria bacterium]
MRDQVSVLFTEEQIARRVGELGEDITRAFAGREVCVLGLMKGSLVFMADLIRRIPLDLTVHLVRVTSQREQAAGRILTEIVFSTSVPLEGKDVLLVDDIVDTGVTLSYLLAHIHEHGPKSLRVCALVDKPEARKIEVHPDWTAFPVHEPMADRFLVGYGLDWMERFRGLPFIGTIARPR